MLFHFVQKRRLALVVVAAGSIFLLIGVIKGRIFKIFLKCSIAIKSLWNNFWRSEKMLVSDGIWRLIRAKTSSINYFNFVLFSSWVIKYDSMNFYVMCLNAVLIIVSRFIKILLINWTFVLTEFLTAVNRSNLNRSNCNLHWAHFSFNCLCIVLPQKIKNIFLSYLYV